MAIVGVNATEAAPAGTTVAGTAEGFKGLADGFRDTVGNADKAAGKDPGIPGGFKSFGEDYVDALTQVEHHGVSVGHNTTGGATISVSYDTDIGNRYKATSASIPPINAAA